MGSQSTAAVTGLTRSIVPISTNVGPNGTPNPMVR